MMDRYDLVVLGAGPAGEKAATQAAFYGKRVAVVERKPHPGGTAVSDAGIPTKTLRETALYLTGFRQRKVYGLSLQLEASMKLERLNARRAELFGMMTEVVRLNLARMGVDLIQGDARLTGEKTVAVKTAHGERILTGQVILIATGSRPARPAEIPFADPSVDCSEGILELERLPKSLAVVGGGAIGCEYASIFSALGVEVTLVEGNDALLAFADREVAHALADEFRAQGMHVLLSSLPESIHRDGKDMELRFQGREPLHVGHVLFAGGRVSNTENIGLAEVGVKTDGKGRVVVDDHYRTTVPGIFAAGDVIGPPGLASVSMEQGRVAVCHAFGIEFKNQVDQMAPLGVYCVPEVGMAGLTEEAARARGIDYEVGRGMFARNTRARIAGATEGFVKLVFRRSDHVLLGVHVLGDIAAELVHVGQMACAQGRPIDDFIHTTFNVPTYTEAYKYAAYDGLQRISKLVR